MNVFPESLLPIGGVIISVALLAWWGSGRIYNILRSIGTTDVAKIGGRGKKYS